MTIANRAQPDIMATKPAVRAIVDRIVARFHPRQVVLFGSYARGTATTFSDVDLLVVFDVAADKRRTAIDIRRVVSDLPLCKDIVVTTRDEITQRGELAGSILRPALREGMILYDRP